MRKWEDIVKDKLEEPGEALPESVFAEFHDRLDASATAPPRKAFPVMWALVPAIAAGLAAVLFLRQPSVPDGGIQIIQQPVVPVAVAPDTAEIAEPVQETMLVAQAVVPKTHNRPLGSKEEHIIRQNENVGPEAGEERTHSEKEDTPSSRQSGDKTSDPHAGTTTSPFLPDVRHAAPAGIKVAPAAGMVAGGGLVAALASPLLASSAARETSPFELGEKVQGEIITDSESPTDVPTGAPSHYLPFKMGLSAGIPIAERLKITTGLAYSLYRSDFTYSLSGQKKQSAHYLGIPVRLDWTLAGSRRLDVYLGGGLEGDFCLGASLDGQSIKRDGFALSLLGAGGIQFNAAKRLGLYVEPQLSWTVPSKNRKLETYRSGHPLMFSVATGLRINLGK